MAEDAVPPPPPPSPPSTTLHRRLLALDAAVSHHLHALGFPFVPLPLLLLLEFSGDGRLWFPLSLALLLSPYSSPSSNPLPLTLLIALLLDVVVIGLMKHLVKRPRPAYNAAMGRIIPVDHWSFPSGHASRVCAIASVLCLNHSGDDAVLVGVWVWAGVTAGSRVVLGRHYVVDVVAGLWIGMVVGFVADWIGRVYVLDLWTQRY